MRTFSKDREAISKLSREQYRVTQQGGTEAPGTGAYLHNDEPGIYVDVVSGEPLSASSDKFESGSGWPTRPIDPANINEVRDTTHGMTRIEVRSTHGDSHLGHVFPDDVGSSYRSAIFYTSEEQKRIADDTIADVDASGLWPGKVVTEVVPAGDFWEAQPEHQDYLQRYPDGYTCHFARPN